MINASLKSKAFEISLEKVTSNDEVIFYLGEPIESSFFVTGESESGYLEAIYSISGPLNSAEVYLDAREIQGKWVIRGLEVNIEKINIVINVLDLPQ